MDNKKDVSKLFQESFTGFSVENSPQIEAMIKQKLKKSKMFRVGKKACISLIALSILALITTFWPFTKVGLQNDSIIEFQQKLEKEKSLTKSVFESKKLEPDNSEFESITTEIISNNRYLEKENFPMKTISEKTEEVKKPRKVSIYNKINIAYSEDVAENDLEFLTSQTVSNPQLNKNRQELNHKPSEASTIKKADKKKKTKKYHIQKHKQRKPSHMIPSKYIGLLDVGLSAFTFNNRISSKMPTNDTVIYRVVKEKPQLSYGFGLDFQLMNKQRPLFIQLGLHYQNYREKIDFQMIREYVDHDKSYWDCDSIFEYHINPPFFDTVLAGIDSNYIEYVVRKENSKEHINTYQYLSIPVMIGYQINKQYSPLKFEFSVGMNLAVLLKNQGYYYSNDGYIIDFASYSTSVFLQYNMMAQIGVYYQWRNINLFARPYFQYQLNKNEWNPPLQGRKYLVYGLNFGLRFKMF